MNSSTPISSLARPGDELARAIEQLSVHRHLCLIHDTQAEQFAAILPFMRIGLQRGERCIYLADENTAQAVLDALRQSGIAVDDHLRSGALSIASKRDSYLKPGHFDPDWMLGFLKEHVQAAKAAGFSALRAASEMTWALGPEPGVDRLLEYEAKLNYFYSEHDILGICQYHRARFQPEIIKGIIETHPLVIAGGLVGRNQYYIPPDQYLKAESVSQQVDRLLAGIQTRARYEQELDQNQGQLAEANRQLHDEIARRSQLEAELETRVTARTAQWATANRELAASRSAALNMMEDADEARRQVEQTNAELRRENAERKQAEEALKKSAQLLMDTGAMAKVGGWELDLATQEVSWTEEVCRIHGVEPGYKPKLEEALSFFAPESRPALEGVLKKAAETGEPWDLESLFIPRGSKDQIWVRSLGKAVYSGGKIVELAGTFQNIDKYKRAEEAVRESEARLRVSVEASNVGLWDWDLRTNTVSFSHEWKSQMGYRDDEISNRFDEWQSRVHPDDLAATLQKVRAFIADPQGRHEVEFRFRHKDGSYRWIYTRADVLRDAGGKSVRMLGCHIDITERKRAEEELKLRNEELIRFTYTVSHDLKSPLVTLRTFLGYLEQDSRNQDAARVAKDLDYMRMAADKMSRLLDELLELSRIGHKVNPPVEAPLQAIVDEALALVAGAIAQRGVQVQVTEEPIRLYGDRLRLVQVFQNLVDNAVKFMGDQPAPRVEIGVEQARDELVLFVRDNGIGIDPRHQPKLFGLFEKLDPGTQGTGIGLALVRRVVEVHGGRIWVESAGPGQGATFRFTLAKMTQ